MPNCKSFLVFTYALHFDLRRWGVFIATRQNNWVLYATRQNTLVFNVNMISISCKHVFFPWKRRHTRRGHIHDDGVLNAIFKAHSRPLIPWRKTLLFYRGSATYAIVLANGAVPRVPAPFKYSRNGWCVKAPTPRLVIWTTLTTHTWRHYYWERTVVFVEMAISLSAEVCG